MKVDIDLYPYATELYEELDRIGIISRIKEIPQLGVIKVSKKLEKTRYDYVMLQLYLHQLIKNNLQGQLRLTYNNAIRATEFREDYTYNSKKDKPSLGDVIQLLTISYNIKPPLEVVVGDLVTSEQIQNCDKRRGAGTNGEKMVCFCAFLHVEVTRIFAVGFSK